MNNVRIGSCVTAMLMALALAGLASAAEQKTTATPSGEIRALELDLPKPVAGGTPRPVPPSVHIDPGYFGKVRPALFVPKDVRLISLKKEVTASDKEPIIGELAMITDGDKAGTDGSNVEMAPGVQWVQIDLKEPSELYAVVLWHFHNQMIQRVYHDVIVRCADDPDFVTGVKTLFNNDYDNSAGLGVGKDKEYIEDFQGHLFDLGKADGGKPVKTRYLRFYSNGNTANEMNHYIEAEVYGKPAK